MPLLTRPSPPPTSAADPAEVVPSAAALLTVLRTGVRPARWQHPLLAVAAQLGKQHRTQWDAEDLSRQAAAGDAAIAAAKRRIDGLNQRRAECVDRIDAWCDKHLPTAGADVPLHTETVGSVVDRLAIAVVRAARLDNERAVTQLAELVHAYGVLADELANGRRRVPSWRTLKAYGTPR